MSSDLDLFFHHSSNPPLHSDGHKSINEDDDDYRVIQGDNKQEFDEDYKQINDNDNVEFYNDFDAINGNENKGFDLDAFENQQFEEVYRREDDGEEYEEEDEYEDESDSPA